ncbi:hypothetical protein [Streptomyces yanii]|uniref:Uncharacterized protein n=1 Tax=Streptomyces yanii TaxID=78510 RepID=A0ABV5R036_9ACTN
MDLLRNQGKIHIEVRERIQQSRGVGGIFRLFRGSQVSQLLGELFALCAQRGVLPPNRVTELLLLIRTEIVSLVVAAETVGEGADEAGLTLADGADGALQCGPLLGDAVAGVIHGPSGFECGCEKTAPIGAEDPCGEEAGDGCDQDLFADPQALGVVGKPRQATMFVRVGLTGVVRDLVAGLAVRCGVAQQAPARAWLPGGGDTGAAGVLHGVVAVHDPPRQLRSGGAH